MSADTDLEPIEGLNNIVPVKSSPLLRGRGTCAECEFSAKEQVDRVCRLEPPKVFMFPVPGMMMTPQGPRPGHELKSFTQFPIVLDGQWCGKHEYRKTR